MKKVFMLTLVLLMGATATKMQAKGEDPTTESAVKFEHLVFDFGDIDYASAGNHTFTFKNVSKKAVTVTNVTASCGCTTPSYSKEPVMPGKKGNIMAHYDTTRIGQFQKTLTVTVNDETIILTIKGNVKAPKSDTTNK
jgi:hypothetical protein